MRTNHFAALLSLVAFSSVAWADPSGLPPTPNAPLPPSIPFGAQTVTSLPPLPMVHDQGVTMQTQTMALSGVSFERVRLISVLGRVALIKEFDANNNEQGAWQVGHLQKLMMKGQMLQAVIDGDLVTLKSGRNTVWEGGVSSAPLSKVSGVPDTTLSVGVGVRALPSSRNGFGDMTTSGSGAASANKTN